MTEGVISGGWEFVWAAYGITAAVFVLYGISLLSRMREARKK
jgi:heme exporter protein D